VTRMVGISLRRAGEFDLSRLVLDEALNLAATAEERSAALQEISLLDQQITGKRTDRSRENLSKARNALKDKPDPWLQANVDFGLLSMTIIALQSRPWLLFNLPVLFRRYKRDIHILGVQIQDKESAALHESLLNLYRGRLRFKLLGWLARFIQPLGAWILQPFDVARSTIGDAKDIHIHSRVDVLAYRAITLAYLHRCRDAQQDMDEIGRLVEILNDNARSEHWKTQRRMIEDYCAKSRKM